MQGKRGGGGEYVDKVYVKIIIVKLKVSNVQNGLTRLFSELKRNLSQKDTLTLKVHKIDKFFDSDFGICFISLLVMHK